MSVMRNRIRWIDAARGIAILLVVLGHCIGNLTDPVNKVILSFHMPLFFFLSGMCAKYENGKFVDYLKKKTKTLLIPQATLGLINCIRDIALGKWCGGGENSLINYFLGWFLLVLYCVSICFYGLQKINFNKRFIKIFVIAGDLAVVILLDLIGVTSKFHLEIVPMALLFYMLGFYCKGLNRERMGKCLGNMISNFWILLFPVIVICSYWNTPIAMYLNDYGNLLFFFLGAFSGILFICMLAKSIEENGFVCWIGQNSIIIYVLHFTMIKGVHLIGKTLFPELTEINYLYPANWHYFLITVLLLIPVVYICDRWFGIFFGKGANRS